MVDYGDTDLARAVAEATSWRGVLRLLGLTPHSSSAMRTARRRADALGLSYRHFTGQRRWSDADLADAVRLSHTWTEVLDRLALASTNASSRAMLKSHVARLGLDVQHLASASAARPTPLSAPATPENLRRAGPMLAASWFTLCGYDAAWPLEPCRYDLIVTKGRESYRIQVKTTTTKADDSWVGRIASNRRSGAAVYSPDDVDYFFVIDGDMTIYLIPLAVVGGFQAIWLRRYTDFIVRREWLDLG